MELNHQQIEQNENEPKHYGMLLRLPDGSEVILDYSCYSFEPISLKYMYELVRPAEYIYDAHGLLPPAVFTAYVDFTNAFVDRIRKPVHPFAQCFRRSNTKGTDPDKAFFFIRWKQIPVDVFQLMHYYRVESKQFVMMFCPSSKDYYFSGGCMGRVSGYGFGGSSHSYDFVRGLDALRALCLFFGIRQPRYLKGLPFKKSDADVLVRLTQTVDTGVMHPAKGMLN